jgi:hypothetical protein
LLIDLNYERFNGLTSDIVASYRKNLEIFELDTLIGSFDIFILNY